MNYEKYQKSPILIRRIQGWNDWFCAGFASLGVGLFPKASGTIGSLLALLLWIPLSTQSLSIRVLALVFVIVVGTIAAHQCIRFWGQDPSQVIIDEVAGMWLTLLFIPPILSLWIIGFVLFRLFDILKPTPIREVENLKGGVGVMMDDLIAGLYALLLLTVFHVILKGSLLQ